MGRQVAKYHKNLTLPEIEAIEMSFETEGELICERGSERFYYIIMDEIIGASLGEETKLVKVQRSTSGPVHGYPITRDELIEQLRKNNSEALNKFLERCPR